QGVYLDDCTQLELPDGAAAAFPGGRRSSDGTAFARMKVLLRWELQGGALRHLSTHPGRTGDTTALAGAPPLPPGCLHLADLGFLACARLAAEAEAGVYWLTRLPAQTRLFLAGPARPRRTACRWGRSCGAGGGKGGRRWTWPPAPATRRPSGAG